MTKGIFITYILLSLFISYLGVSYDLIPTPFGYNDLVSLNEFWTTALILLSSLLLYIIAYYFFTYKNKCKKIITNIVPVKTIKNTPFLVVKKSNVYCLFLQVGIILYFLTIFIVNLDEYMTSTAYIRRIFEGKLTQLMLIIQCFILLFSRGWGKTVVAFCALLLAFTVAWFDGSRSSLIPLFAFILTAYVEKKYLKSLFYVFLILYMYIFCMGVREVDDKFSVFILLGYIFESFVNFFDLFINLIGYLTSFSILHFAYVNETQKGFYGINDFLYSISPFPSFIFKPASIDEELWKIGPARAIGGAGEIYRVSIILFYLVFIYFAWLTSKIDKMLTVYIKLIAISIFVLSIIVFFQYSLRAVHWFYYFLMLLIFIDYRISNKQ